MPGAVAAAFSRSTRAKRRPRSSARWRRSTRRGESSMPDSFRRHHPATGDPAVSKRRRASWTWSVPTPDRSCSGFLHGSMPTCGMARRYAHLTICPMSSSPRSRRAPAGLTSNEEAARAVGGHRALPTCRIATRSRPEGCARRGTAVRTPILTRGLRRKGGGVLARPIS